MDGVPVAAEGWSRRQAAALVKVLALAPGHRLHREQVIEALWPHRAVDAAGPRLHKAAHYARRALGGAPGAAAAAQRDGRAVCPTATCVVDVDEFASCRAERAGRP